MRLRGPIGALVGIALAAVPAAQAAYQPKFSLELSDRGPATAPVVTARVSQAPGESASRRLAVRYPPQFGFNPGFAVTGCAPPDEQADACPESSRIGRARADTLLGPFSGPVYITSDFRLLTYLEGIGGVGRQRFEGKLYVRPDGSIEAVFDDLPNIAATLAETTLEGGSRGLLLTPRGCGRYTVTGSFTSHSGEQVTSDVPVEIAGCPQRPVITAARARPRRFRARTTLAWNLSQPALRTTVSVRRRRSWGWRELRRLRGPGEAGRNTLRIGARGLPPGRYRFVLRAVGAGGQVSRSRSAAATILPAKRTP